MIALVAYATKHGSTREVADAIGKQLRERGFGVDVMEARAIPADLNGYDLVVLGGALYIGRWHHDAVAFLKQHRTELASKPLAVFGMGPARDEKPAFDAARAQLEHSLARAAVTPALTVRRRCPTEAAAVPVQLDARLRRPRLGGDRELRHAGRGPRRITRGHRRNLTRLTATAPSEATPPGWRSPTASRLSEATTAGLERYECPPFAGDVHPALPRQSMPCSRRTPAPAPARPPAACGGRLARSDTAQPGTP